MSADEADSFIRAVAAAPLQSPPAIQTTAVLLAPDSAAALARARAVAAFGAKLDLRTDETLLAAFTGHDAAVRAASCALAWRDAAPHSHIVVATSAAEIAAADSALALMKHAQESKGGAIVVDDASAAHLDARFDVHMRAGGNVLVGFRSDPPPPPADRPVRMHWLTLSFPDRELERQYKRPRRFPWFNFFLFSCFCVSSFVVAAAVPNMVGPTGHDLIAKLTYRWIIPAVATLLLVSRFAPARDRDRWVTRCGQISSFVYASTHPALILLGGEPILLFSGLCMIVFMISIPLLPPARLGPGAATSTVMFAGFESSLLLTHRVPFGPKLTVTFMLIVAYMVGVMTAYVFERQKRRLFLQKRILDAERAKTERLERAAHEREVQALSGELKRQVAERAGRLADTLARLRPDAALSLVSGAVVDDRYRVVRAIGRGGMGAVYEVERLVDGRRLALKTLTRVADPEALARFAREAQVAAALDHPNVVSVLDVDVSRTGMLFLVMELVAGASLAAARARYGEIAWSIGIVRQIAEALSTMHARGILHRDLKPANVLLDGERAKVADFGLAGLSDVAPLASTQEAAADDSPALTRSGAIMGTPLYMAPELVHGARAGGPASDVFSLGVVAYELLTKQLPHAAPPVLERLAGRLPPSPRPIADARRDLRPELASLIDRCLAERPEQRPSSAEVAATIERKRL